MLKSSLRLGCATIALCIVTPAVAQESVPADHGLEEIIVTARRIEENQQKVPVAVTTLTAATLERRNVTTVNDIQFSVPNLQIRPSSINPSRPEIILRGQRQVNQTDENVVTYVNGVAQSTRGLTFYDLESVQALKGPQGTLFGKNSMGGALVVTTKRPVFDTEGQISAEYGNYDRRLVNGMLNIPLVTDKVALRAAGQIERQDGFFRNVNPGQKDLNNRHNETGRVSLLIKPDDRFENLTTVDYIHRNEIPTPAVIDAAPLNGNFFRSVTQQAVMQQSALGGGTAVMDTASGLLVRRGNPFRSTAFTGVGNTLPGFYFVNGVQTNGSPQVISTFGARSEVYGLSNATTYELNDTITLKNILGYRHEKAIDHQDPSGISGMILNFAGVLGSPVSGYATNNDTYYRNNYKTFSNEFQIIGTMDNLRFIAGGFYAHTKHLYAVNSSFVVGPASFYGPRPTRHSQMNDSTDSKALFAQATYDFSGVGLDGLRVTAGLRYTKDKKKNVNENFFTSTVDQLQSWDASRPQAACNELNTTLGSVVAINNGAQCQISGQRTFKALTWTASVEYQATPDTLLYFANRRGFKAGGPNPTTRLLQYNLFGPERITDFELGLKHQGRLGTVPYRLNVAGFIGKYKQIQTTDILQFCANQAADPANGPACGTFTDAIILNLGKATIKGVEIDASIKPIPQLELNAGYSYQVGRYGAGSIVPQPTNPALPIANSNPINFAGGVNLQGSEFAGVPRTTLTASATLDLDFVPESFAKTRLSANYFYRGSTKGLAVQGIYQTPGFSTIGGRISFDNLFGSDVSFAIWGSNLADKHYKLFCSNNLNSIGYATCKWGDPRTYGVTGTVKF